MKLSKEERQQLIDTYRSELRKLDYRSQQVTEALEELENEGRASGRPKRAALAAKRAKATRKAAKKRAGKAAKKVAKKATRKTAKKAAKKAAKRGRKAAKKAVKRGRTAGKKAAKKAATKRGRTGKKAAKTGRKSTGRGYRLNQWDEIVISTLQKKQVGVFADFYGAAKRTAAGKRLSGTALYARINQSLHKLANKRGLLKKVQHEGRGYGYKLA